jgi:hypothetical protein
MIISAISDGMGNQLFRYAAGRSLSLHHNTPLKLDITNAPKLSLSYFEVPLSIASKEEIADYLGIFGWMSKKWRRITCKLIHKLIPASRLRYYNQPSFEFDDSFFKGGGNAYLKGWWQSEKFFLSYADQIREDLAIKQEYITNVEEIATKMASQNSISLHIRRGDYLSAHFSYMVSLSLSHYHKAIEVIAEKYPDDPILYLFSDDPAWLKDNFTSSYPFQIVSETYTKTDIEDFYLISKCKHNIIANSTFSWWAAWLNTNPSKMVIAPTKWQETGINTKDLVPETWIKM